MGKMTMGILLGVRVPDGVELCNDGDDSGLLDRWSLACRDRIVDHNRAVHSWVMSRPGRMPYMRISGAERYVPGWPPDVDLIGFWIAAGASGLPGLPILGEWQSPGYIPVGFSRAGVREAYPRAYRNARIRWRRFARWAEAQGVTLPRATLWLTPTEVA